LRGLADKYASRADVAFVIVYQREPHAGRMAFADLAQPATFAERRALATRAKDELGLPLLSLVDGMDDASRALFSDLPAPVFALDRFGHVAAKEPWIDVDKLPAMLDAALVARPPAGSTRSAFARSARGARRPPRRRVRRRRVPPRAAPRRRRSATRRARFATIRPRPTTTARRPRSRLRRPRRTGRTSTPRCAPRRASSGRVRCVTPPR
jgi:hypothetical protein